jgi:antitoxin HicB
MKVLDYTVLFEPVEEGGYMVVVPALPGVVSYGKTLDEARTMAADAIRCHCEGLLKDGEQCPADKPIRLEPVKENVRVELEYA